jgi:hypothetical protein
MPHLRAPSTHSSNFDLNCRMDAVIAQARKESAHEMSFRGGSRKL